MMPISNSVRRPLWRASGHPTRAHSGELIDYGSYRAYAIVSANRAEWYLQLHRTFPPWQRLTYTRRGLVRERTLFQPTNRPEPTGNPDKGESHDDHEGSSDR